jgi:DNA-directed RNA polymerase
MLSRLVGRRASMIWPARLFTKWVHPSLGRRVVMPLLTQYTLLNTHSTTIVASRASRAQYTTTAKVPIASLSNTTPKQQEILILNKDQIFVDPQTIDIDYRLALMYARLKAGYIYRARKIYRNLTADYHVQEERFADVNIYNAFIEAYMKRSGKSIRKALKLFDEMRKQNIKPNLTTYAILIKGFLRAGIAGRAHVLLMEMLREGHSITAFMLNRNISNADLKKLKLIRKAKEGDYFGISSAQINKLLSSMGKPTTKSTKTSIDHSSVLEARSANVLDVRLLKASLIPVAVNNTKLYERQLRFEEQAVSASIERLRKMAEAQDAETSSNSYSLQSLMWSWHQKLYPMIVEEQQSASNFFGNTDKYIYGLFFSLLDAEKLSMMTIQQLLRLSMNRDMLNDINATYAMEEIGNAIEMEYYTEQLRKRKNDLARARCLNLQALYSSGQLFDTHTRGVQAKLLEEEGGDWLERWPKLFRIEMGSLLISMLLRVAKIKTTYYDKETGRHV